MSRVNIKMVLNPDRMSALLYSNSGRGLALIPVPPSSGKSSRAGFCTHHGARQLPELLLSNYQVLLHRIPPVKSNFLYLWLACSGINEA